MPRGFILYNLKPRITRVLVLFLAPISVILEKILVFYDAFFVGCFFVGFCLGLGGFFGNGFWFFFFVTLVNLREALV